MAVGEGRGLGELVGSAVGAAVAGAGVAATAGPRTVISTVAGMDVMNPSDTRYVKLSVPVKVDAGV
jgi:hypothetical protein